jgi:phenylacetic acid degradation operon negative regulatory protein
MSSMSRHADIDPGSAAGAPPCSIAELASGFGQRPEISARSVLVTVFGDSVVPAGGEIWLGDLISLTRPFGFSDRLVRTSVSRLTSEGWFDTERVGRRSRYRLTAQARAEFAAAERRIYHVRRPEWGGDWTLVFADLVGVDREVGSLLSKHLAWRGFVTLAPGVHALPGDGRLEVAEVAERVGLDATVPCASAHFDDLHALVDGGELARRLGLGEASEGYRLFLERYRWLERVDGSLLGDQEAFLLRTMVIHDLRRATLADPWLPRELLPSDWPGRSAHRLAAVGYRQVDAGARRWLASETGLEQCSVETGSGPRFAGL